jgi:hypothetical protein
VARGRSLSADYRHIGIAPIRGGYCPVTGRIHFLHNNLNSHITVRVFTGNVSDGDPGQTWYMGGTMTVVNVGFGPFGEFNFSAVEQCVAPDRYCADAECGGEVPCPDAHAATRGTRLYTNVELCYRDRRTALA